MFKFEVGKFYKHTTGLRIAVLAEVETTIFGKCLVAESNIHQNLLPLSNSYEATMNYEEITQEEWMECFPDM